MANRPFFREEFPSTFEAMTATLDHAVEALLSEGWIQDTDVACIRLCLEEALVNAVRHGNNSDANRSVVLNMYSRDEDCVIRVSDEGGGFSLQEVALPECDQMGGRGICLIRHFMDDVNFDNAAHCLEMSFRRKTA